MWDLNKTYVISVIMGYIEKKIKDDKNKIYF